MGTYSNNLKGKKRKWRYDFTLNGQRYTGKWFRKESEAKNAEKERRDELDNPKEAQPQIPIDMGFLDLVNRRLDYLKDWTTPNHYQDTKYRAWPVGQTLGCATVWGDNR
jgi:hypothetical protein